LHCYGDGGVDYIPKHLFFIKKYVVLAKVNFYFLKKHLLPKIRRNREFSHTTVRDQMQVQRMLESGFGPSGCG